MTKRANGEGTIYREAGGRWVGMVYVRTAEGARKRKTVRAATQKEVKKQLQEIVRLVDAGVPVSSRRAPTIKEFGESWVQQVLPQEVALGHISPRTADNYTTMWTTHVEPSLGHIRIDRLTPSLVRTWLAAKQDATGRTGRPLGDRSRQLMHAVLRRALRDAMRDDLVLRNVAALVPTPRVVRKPLEPLTKHEAKLVLVAARSDPQGALWLLLLSLGLRLGEALSLQWQDLDLDGATIRIQRSAGRVRGVPDAAGVRATELVVGRTKTPESSAMLALPQAVVAALRRHRVAQVKAQVAAGSWSDTSLVFTTRSGGLLDGRNVLRAWKSFASKAGIERDTWLHLLRHSTGTFLLVQGVPMEVIKATLRHTRLATTADLYAHVTRELQRDAAVAMDDILAGLADDETESAG